MNLSGQAVKCLLLATTMSITRFQDLIQPFSEDKDSKIDFQFSSPSRLGLQDITISPTMTRKRQGSMHSPLLSTNRLSIPLMENIKILSFRSCTRTLRQARLECSCYSLTEMKETSIMNSLEHSLIPIQIT